MERAEIAAGFGANVKAAREAKGLSQDELSRRHPDLSVAQISRIERGQRDVRISTLLLFASALEVSPNELLKGLY